MIIKQNLGCNCRTNFSQCRQFCLYITVVTRYKIVGMRHGCKHDNTADILHYSYGINEWPTKQTYEAIQVLRACHLTLTKVTDELLWTHNEDMKKHRCTPIKVYFIVQCTNLNCIVQFLQYPILISVWCTR